MSRWPRASLVVIFLACLGGLWGLSRWLDHAGRRRELPGEPWNPHVRVWLSKASGSTAQELSLSGDWRLLDGEGRELRRGVDFEGLLQLDPAGALMGPFRVAHDLFYLETLGDGGVRIGSRAYRGRLKIELERGAGRLPQRFEVYLELPLEDYAAGVVSGELPASLPRVGAALRAQAILARTYALWKLQSGRISLRDTAEDQRFESMEMETEAARAAVRETRGLVLTWEDELLPAWYHALCGGATAGAEQIGFHRAKLPPLCGVADPYCAPTVTWRQQVSAAELDRFAASEGLGDCLRRVQVTRRDAAGRLLEARLDGATASKHYRGEDLRRAFRTRSTFWTELESLPDGSLLIYGAGNGHGVGLCQQGAIRMAQDGKSHQEVLAHYYPRAAIRSLYTTPTLAP